MLRLTNIRNADGSLISGIDVDDGKETFEERDMSELLAVPGFFDSHIHGSFGFDVSDGITDDIELLAQKMPSFGVSLFLPTLMTLDEERILKAAEAVSNAKDRLKSSDSAFASIAGLRLEGPCLSPDKAGVQDPGCLVDADRLSVIISKIESGFPGLLKMIDIAPEIGGAIDLVKEYKDRYIFSLAHSDCGYEKAMEFFNAGGKCLTHALNAMRPCLKRDPGPLGAAFDHKDPYIEVICDGHHVDQTVLRMLFNLFDGRIAVISDAMRAAGMPDGTYDLGGTEVVSRGGRTYFGPSGNLAGSVSYLSQEAERLFSYGIPQEPVIRALTKTPEERLNVGTAASCSDGKPDLNFVDGHLRLKCVISRGRLVTPYIML